MNIGRTETHLVPQPAELDPEPAQEPNMKITKHQVGVGLLAVAIAATVTLACQKVNFGTLGSDGVQVGCTAACTGNGTYLDCPTSDACAWTLHGADSCTCVTILLKCGVYQGGTAAPVTLCCTAGTYVGMTATPIAPVSQCTLTGECIWGVF